MLEEVALEAQVQLKSARSLLVAEGHRQIFVEEGAARDLYGGSQASRAPSTPQPGSDGWASGGGSSSNPRSEPGAGDSGGSNCDQHQGDEADGGCAGNTIISAAAANGCPLGCGAGRGGPVPKVLACDGDADGGLDGSLSLPCPPIEVVLSSAGGAKQPAAVSAVAQVATVLPPPAASVLGPPQGASVFPIADPGSAGWVPVSASAALGAAGCLRLEMHSSVMSVTGQLPEIETMFMCGPVPPCPGMAASGVAASGATNLGMAALGEAAIGKGMRSSHAMDEGTCCQLGSITEPSMGNSKPDLTAVAVRPQLDLAASDAKELLELAVSPSMKVVRRSRRAQSIDQLSPGAAEVQGASSPLKAMLWQVAGAAYKCMAPRS